MTAARQPRCFPPIGIDVHEARAFCVHRQVLHSRESLFLISVFRWRATLAKWRGHAFFTARFRPASTAPSDAFLPRRVPRGTPFRSGLVDFLEGIEAAWCGSVVPDRVEKDFVVSRFDREPVVSRLTAGWVRPQRPKRLLRSRPLAELMYRELRRRLCAM